MIFSGLLVSGLAASAAASRICRPHTSPTSAQTQVLTTKTDSTLASESSTLPSETIPTESESTVATVTNVASTETSPESINSKTETMSETMTFSSDTSGSTTVTSGTSFIPTTASGTGTTSSAPTLRTRTPVGPWAGQIVTACTKPGDVALAFYGGPTQYTGQILDLLDATGYKGTFFLTGSSINGYTSVIQRMYAEGHQVASEGWADIDMGQASPIQIQDNMIRLEDALISIAGIQPNYYMPRPPAFVGTDGGALDTLRNLGYRVISYDIDPLDNTPGITPEEVKSRIMAGLDSSGTILPLHEDSPSLVNDILPFAISRIQNGAFTGAAVGACLNDPSSMLYSINP